ncbi:Rpn family recombination-promoting nuclease/putative transposase [Castellaniella hirudinis]|uniref:Rpn family recombination-promoting nuclease/putative transposase n=1 Tax=Castellaniella hirudinis TaxID=1144617 RepID=A0ABV8S0U1_9BURK
MNRHDACYRRLFSDPRLLRDLLACAVQDPWIDTLNWIGLQPVPAEYISDDLRRRCGDAVWRIPQKPAADGTPPATDLYILILLEFQSQPVRIMALRLLTYAGLLYESLLQHRLIPTGAPLPLLLPIVLYSGHRRWRAPTELSALLTPADPALARYQPQLRYLLIDEGALLQAGALPDRNLATLLFRMEHAQGIDELREIVHTLLDATIDPGFEELRRAFTLWLRHVLLARVVPSASPPETTDLQEFNMTLAEKAITWTEQWEQQGQAHLLEHQLAHRFGPLPAHLIEQLHSASATQLEAWALNVIDAATLDEVFRG